MIDGNFGKFLLDKNGRVIQYLDSDTDVLHFMADVQYLLMEVGDEHREL